MLFPTRSWRFMGLGCAGGLFSLSVLDRLCLFAERPTRVFPLFSPFRGCFSRRRIGRGCDLDGDWSRFRGLSFFWVWFGRGFCRIGGASAGRWAGLVDRPGGRRFLCSRCGTVGSGTLLFPLLAPGCMWGWIRGLGCSTAALDPLLVRCTFYTRFGRGFWLAHRCGLGRLLGMAAVLGVVIHLITDF